MHCRSTAGTPCDEGSGSRCLLLSILSMLAIRRAGRRSARRLRRVVDVRPGKTSALAWSWLYVFALFLAYYVMRPIRDELGVAGGVRNLPWLFTGTLLAMLVVNLLFAWS